MKHRSYRGRVDYIHDDIGERGREWFSVTVQPDGMRTLRSQCEMDDTRILRDVTYTVDECWRPIDAYVRISVEETFMGAAWFRFGAEIVECLIGVERTGIAGQALHDDFGIRVDENGHGIGP